MKLFGLSLSYFIAAVVIGLALSFGASYFMVPQPVDVYKTEIVPVPTPAPVYVTLAPTQVQTQATVALTPAPEPTQDYRDPEIVAMEQAIEDVNESLVFAVTSMIPMVIIAVIVGFVMMLPSRI